MIKVKLRRIQKRPAGFKLDEVIILEIEFCFALYEKFLLRSVRNSVGHVRIGSLIRNGHSMQHTV